MLKYGVRSLNNTSVHSLSNYFSLFISLKKEMDDGLDEAFSR